MNGTVELSASSSAVARTCAVPIDSSRAIFPRWSGFTRSVVVVIAEPRQTAKRFGEVVVEPRCVGCVQLNESTEVRIAEQGLIAQEQATVVGADDAVGFSG